MGKDQKIDKKTTQRLIVPKVKLVKSTLPRLRGRVRGRHKSYVIPSETLILGEGGKRFTLVLDMPHI